MNRYLWIGLISVTAMNDGAPNAKAQFGNLLRRGPKIEIITTTELTSLLDQQRQIEKTASETGQQPKPAKFVLVDVRGDAETEVSIIPGAITKSQYEKHRSKYQGRTVIAYCTFGGRSGKYATQLAKAGVQVKNYEASILGWVKNDLPVVTPQGKPTNRVHTYSDQYDVPSGYQQVTD
ncbi:MAG: rhodanese-like domain-containing protein [Rubripirellula sp.]|nr:rhodanese-like domain-containing protein [Rubripirellula sp.]